MFQSAQLVLDVFGRPIFVLPADIQQGQSISLRVNNKHLDFIAGTKHIGHIENLTTEILALVALQKNIGIIAWPDDTKPCPSSLTHVANVEAQVNG